MREINHSVQFLSRHDSIYIELFTLLAFVAMQREWKKKKTQKRFKDKFLNNLRETSAVERDQACPTQTGLLFSKKFR